ncbi:MAG: pheS [Candidatus Magasanikbacteria bacterium]|nr:pheS [Candidatus Magasanikbacteria bacterium]
MEADLHSLQTAAVAAVSKAQNLSELTAVEVRFLGRKGEFTALAKKIVELPDAERKRIGQVANEVRQRITLALANRIGEIKMASRGNLADTEWIDVTEPGVAPAVGRLHFTTRIILEITQIFERLGFSRVRYPEAEWDWYAFEGLNMPKNHPARDEWETFFIEDPASNGAPEGARPLTDKKFGKMVLTPHTSSGQLREMERVRDLGGPPIRMINIAKCYRRQADVTHVPMFHQFEGLLIDRDVTIADLKGVLDYFAGEFFGPERVTRLRPFHFRFTEPSFEVDISCGVCGGTGFLEAGTVLKGTDLTALREKCRVCKEGWLELGGAGMVHPNVLKNGGLDPEKWSGFAFGWGVERSAMMKSGLKLDDLRIIYKNDLRVTL